MANGQRTACITGGTSGIGKALTLRLLADGWTVFAVGRTSKHAEQLQNEVAEPEAVRLHVSQGDLRDYSLCEEISSRIGRSANRLDLLVNGAGTIGAGGVLEENPERWDLVISSNLTPAFNMTKDASNCSPMLAAPTSSTSHLYALSALADQLHIPSARPGWICLHGQRPGNWPLKV